jgi:hypothetical protein
MKRLILSTNFLLIAMIFGASLVPAQTSNELAKNAFTNIAASGGFKLTELLTQSQLRRPPGFSLMSASRIAKPSRPAFSLISAAAAPVSGSGTTGRIARWVGVEGANTFVLGNSTIFEDKFGKVGIGTDTPTSRFTVAGLIETTSGGVKFPDGTVQTTAGVAPNDVVRSLNGLKGDLLLAGGANITVSSAGNTITVAAPNALTTVAHDATLTGNGTPASPLSVVQSGSQSEIEPVAALAAVNSTSGTDVGQGTLFTVPAGKRLTIEQVSASCAFDTGQRAIGLSIRTTPTTGASEIGHQLIPVFVSDPTITGITYGSQAMKLYAAPGTPVNVAFIRNTITGSSACVFAFSGYLVNSP